MSNDLRAFNAMVRAWAARQPKRYRSTALAFGYRCDKVSHSFQGTMEWVSRCSRRRPGEYVSVAKIKRDLKVFAAAGAITAERQRDGDRNAPSVYHVDFERVIPDLPSLEPEYLTAYLEWQRDGESPQVASGIAPESERLRNEPREGVPMCGEHAHYGNVATDDGDTFHCDRCGKSWAAYDPWKKC